MNNEPLIEINPTTMLPIDVAVGNDEGTRAVDASIEQVMTPIQIAVPMTAIIPKTYDTLSEPLRTLIETEPTHELITGFLMSEKGIFLPPEKKTVDEIKEFINSKPINVSQTIRTVSYDEENDDEDHDDDIDREIEFTVRYNAYMSVTFDRQFKTTIQRDPANLTRQQLDAILMESVEDDEAEELEVTIIDTDIHDTRNEDYANTAGNRVRDWEEV